LYYRLNGVTIAIPPLRERTAEIARLARRFIAEASKQLGAPRELTLTKAALAAPEQHGWPGNIRELKNVIDAAVLMVPGPEDDVEHLSVVTPARASAGRLAADVDALEKQRILEA